MIDFLIFTFISIITITFKKGKSCLLAKKEKAVCTQKGVRLGVTLNFFVQKRFLFVFVQGSWDFLVQPLFCVFGPFLCKVDTGFLCLFLCGFQE
jgi:hypothetical protein